MTKLTSVLGNNLGVVRMGRDSLRDSFASRILGSRIAVENFLVSETFSDRFVTYSIH
ncbi:MULTISPECIES: hypothetical protein [unclassified Microcoleus]|uniref:hypothetical protein n=1 Tax=unclassified Microcoleus TaxID=2642155 RepID=UPI002FD03D4B